MQEFFGRLGQLSSCEAVFKLLRMEGNRIGLSTVALGELPGAGSTKLKPFFYSTWPDNWFEVYSEAGLVGADPLVDAARLSPIPFTWEELEADPERWTLSRDQMKVTQLAREFGRREGLGWKDGFAIPVHGLRGHVGLVSWVGDPRGFDAAMRNDLHLKSLVAYNIMHDLHWRAYGGINEVIAAYGLSQREIEVVVALTRGLSDTRIAAGLGIAERTVQHRVNQAKRKLGCSTRAQLAAAATKLGIVSA